MTPDSELLRRYAAHGDEAAFAEVVHRHVDMVYSTALRLVAGDGPLAQDVTQSVFTDLARKAGTLAGRAALGGWLHTAARFAASKAVNREQRRRQREQEAFAMQDNSTTLEIEIHWEQLRAVLDEAVGRLAEADRDVVVLRFFEGKSHREVGDALGLSEDTARKRVDRALEKMRAHFSRRGVTLSSGLLAAAITANSVQAAPAGFAGSVTTVSLTQATAAGFGGTLSYVLSMTLKTKIVLIAAVVLLCVVAVPVYKFFQSDDNPAKTATAHPNPAATVSSSPKIATSAKRAPVIAAPLLPPPPPSGSASTATAADTTASANEIAARLAVLAGVPGPSPDSLLGDRVTALIAGAPVTLIEKNTEIWEPIPDSTNNGRRIRGDIETIPLQDDRTVDPREYSSGHIYYLPLENRFYVVWEKTISSTIRSYGPFQGDPRVVLKLPPAAPPANAGSNNSAQPAGANQ